jgi:ribosomal protein L37E
MPSLPGQALQSFHLTCASAALAMRQLPRRRRPHPAVLSPSPPQSTRAIFSTGDARRRTGSCSDHDRPTLPPPSRSISRLCDYPASDKASDYPASDKASNRAGASARDAAHDSLLGLGRRSLTPSWPPATLGLPAVALAALSHNRGPVLVGGLIRSLTAKVMAEIRFLLGSPRSRGIDQGERTVRGLRPGAQLIRAIHMIAWRNLACGRAAYSARSGRSPSCGLSARGVLPSTLRK